jgi:hypothetical protein
MSLPVSSNKATSATTIMTSTVKTVAELDTKLCMEQRWAQTSTSPLPEGIQNAIMDLRTALVVQCASLQCTGQWEWREARRCKRRKYVRDGDGEYKEERSRSRRALKEVNTIQGDTNNTTSSPNQTPEVSKWHFQKADEIHSQVHVQPCPTMK